MKSHIIPCFLLLCGSCLALSGCGSKSYADGTYTAQSSEYVNDEDDVSYWQFKELISIGFSHVF